MFSHIKDMTVTGYVKDAIQSVEDSFAVSEHHCWNMDEAFEFIVQHFDKSVQRAFKCLTPLSYKADLFKYCLLYIEGGWYIDAGVKMILNPEVLFKDDYNPDFVLFRSTGGWDAPWNCSLAILYAAPKSPVFITTLEQLVSNCKNKYYGVNPLCPTMSPFGRSIAIHNKNDNIKMGKVVDVKRNDVHRGFRIPPIGLIATRKPKLAKVGNVKDIGLHGSNNYAELWKNREVYNEY